MVLEEVQAFFLAQQKKSFSKIEAYGTWLFWAMFLFRLSVPNHGQTPSSETIPEQGQTAVLLDG
jgi:hypothetical protein